MAIGIGTLLLLGVGVVGVGLAAGILIGREVPRVPRSGWKKIPCPDPEKTAPKLGVRVYNHVPQQDPEQMKAFAESEECWLVEIYDAKCTQGAGWHNPKLKWHEETETQQSVLRYYDIYGGNSYLRWTKGGDGGCEHNDYESFSSFSHPQDETHTSRLELVDMREGQPGMVITYSDAEFHPV